MTLVMFHSWSRTQTKMPVMPVSLPKTMQVNKVLPLFWKGTAAARATMGVPKVHTVPWADLRPTYRTHRKRW